MGFRNRAQSKETEMIPGNFEAAVMDAIDLEGVPEADWYSPEAPVWTEDKPESPPSIEELLRDPGVAAVVEAFKDMPLVQFDTN